MFAMVFTHITHHLHHAEFATLCDASSLKSD